MAGTITRNITTIEKGRISGELGAEVGSLFAKMSSAIKLEPKIREELRQVFKVNVTGLIEVINILLYRHLCPRKTVSACPY